MRDRYVIARSSAWAQFGRRHYRLIVGVELARAAVGPVAVLVLLGAVGYGLWWMWAHLSPGRLALVSALAGGVLLVGFLVREVGTGAGVKRRAAGGRWAVGPVAVLTSVVLLFGASVSALIR